MNLSEAQEKVFRAFMKAFGIEKIHEVPSNLFGQFARDERMKFSGSFTKGIGPCANIFCDEYTGAGGRKYWYVFDLDPISGEVYTVFETTKPRSEKILRDTLWTYGLLLDALWSNGGNFERIDPHNGHKTTFWDFKPNEETPWDAMRRRLEVWVRGY